MKKIVVVQRYLPHYRLPFYEALRERLSGSPYDLLMFYGYELGPARPPTVARRLAAFRISLRLGEMHETMVFLPGLLFRLWREKPDLLVLEDLSGLPNTLIGAIYARLRGCPYLIWGLGAIPAKTPSRVRRWLGPVIHWLYGHCAGFLCYSRHAQQVYATYGKPTYLALNACLPAPTANEQREVAQAIASREIAADLQIVTMGALTSQKRIEVALRAVAGLDFAQWSLQIIGDGADKTTLIELAKSLGISDHVHFHGALYDAAAKRRILESAHVGVLPGRGGLVIQELLRYGIPVISGVADGTELDLLSDGANGYVTAAFLTAETLRERIKQFQKLSAAERSAMSRNALESVMLRCNVQAMADGFVDGIVATLSIRIQPPKNVASHVDRLSRSIP